MIEVVRRVHGFGLAIVSQQIGGVLTVKTPLLEWAFGMLDTNQLAHYTQLSALLFQPGLDLFERAQHALTSGDRATRVGPDEGSSR